MVVFTYLSKQSISEEFNNAKQEYMNMSPVNRQFSYASDLFVVKFQSFFGSIYQELFVINSLDQKHGYEVRNTVTTGKSFTIELFLYFYFF